MNGHDGAFDVGAAHLLFVAHLRPTARLDTLPYAASQDGQRVLVDTFVEDATSTPITLAINWLAALRRVRDPWTSFARGELVEPRAEPLVLRQDQDERMYRSVVRHQMSSEAWALKGPIEYLYY